MVRKGGWDSSSFSLFLSFIHSRISRETAERAVIIRQIVSIILSCCSQFCGLTNIYIRFPAIWFLQGVYLSECGTLHIQKIHYTIYSSPHHPQNLLPIPSCVLHSVVCRNEILRFRLWFFHSHHYFFVRCHGDIQSGVWKQALMRPPNSVLTTRFII